MPDFSGQSIGRYQVIEPLGEGGVAVVYKAYDTHLEREVAIKFIRMRSIPPDQAERLLQRFEREAKRMAKFTHPNIVPVLDYGEHEGTPYLVMPFLGGGTLKDKLKAMGNTPMPYQEAVRILLPIAHALEYAHQHGTIHRDVKPANILLTKEGQPMLSDFGVAKILDVDEGQTLTGTGVGVGTPKYMAPEQWKNQVSERTDIYALGVVLYEMVTARVPYDAETPAGVLEKQLTEPLKRPSSLNPSLSDEMEKILLKALAKEPSARYESMREFAHALERVLHGKSHAAGEDITDDVGAAPSEPENGRSDYQTRGMEKSETYDDNHKDEQHTGELQKVKKGRSNVLAWLLLLAAVGLVSLIFSYTQFRTAQELSATQSQQALEIQSTLSHQAVELQAALTQQILEIQSTITQQAREMQAPQIQRTVEMQAFQTQHTTKATSTPKAGYVKVNEKDGAEMVYVPAGEFLMGLTENEAEAVWKECGKDCERSWIFDEVPQHEVYLDSYWIYKTEVTNDMFATFVKETQWETDAEKAGISWVNNQKTEEWEETVGANWQRPAGENSNIEGKGNYPVVQVSWQDAEAYCEWAGGRLPTEAEWEKAARGTDGRKFPWGNEELTGERLNYCDTNCEFSSSDESENDGYSETAPVGNYPLGASPYGALDMAGNVWEWVQDWYAEDYYTNSPKDYPPGPTTGEERVLRGGAWSDPYLWIRTTDRGKSNPALSTNVTGFRCVVSP